LRYTIKVILNGEVKRCGSDDRQWVQKHFDCFKNLTYRDIFRMYGEDARSGKLEIHMYKKNRRGTNACKNSKKDFNSLVYDLDELVRIENIVFKKIDVTTRYSYNIIDHMPDGCINFMEINKSNVCAIMNQSTFDKFEPKSLFKEVVKSKKLITE